VNNVIAYGVTYKDSNRTITWSLIISAVIHIMAIAPFVKNLVPKEFFQAEARPVVVEPMEFELVNPPPDPIPTEEQSRYRSTVSSAARDDARSDDQSAVPHSEGAIPIVDTPSPTDGADGGGQQELPPQPEEQTDLGEAFRRSRFLTQSSPTQGKSAPLEAPRFRNDGAAHASVGGFTINTTAWDFAPYLLDLKQRIKQQWIPPLAFTALGAIHGYTRINFRIYPDGHMEALSVIEERGHDSLHRASENAIKGAAPFRALPDDFPEDYLDITFGFYYLLPGDEKEFFKQGE
jgi:outer membrane biosynthesis protein TonB